MDLLSNRRSIEKVVIAFERELLQTALSNGIKMSSRDEGEAGEQGIDGENFLYDGSGNSSSSGPVVQFVNEWLSAITDTAVGLFLAQILQVSVFTPLGTSQLFTDIDYLRYFISSTHCRYTYTHEKAKETDFPRFIGM